MTKLVKFFMAILVSATAVFVLGCAENVSHKVEIVKSDLTKLIDLLAQTPSGKISVMAKASSVSATVAYEKNAAIEVQKNVETVLLTLGYKRQPSEKIQSSQQFFCHVTESARSVWIERLNVEPPTLSVSVSITGWKQDAERCPGR